MSEQGHLTEVEFRMGTEWPMDVGDDAGGRDDQYITAEYDVKDGTYSLTYHPTALPITTPCFTQNHAVIALRDAGYSYPQIVKMLADAYGFAMAG